MPRNVEIKARIENLEAMKARVASLADGPAERLKQEDTFFHVPKGRLKLRTLGPKRGELIYYEREDSSGPRRSHYLLTQTSDPAGVLSLLAHALGIRGTVRKVRFVYRIAQTRVHLDSVEGLGAFLELEVELDPDETEEQGAAIARDLLMRLGIRDVGLVGAAYIDLLEKSSR